MALPLLAVGLASTVGGLIAGGKKRRAAKRMRKQGERLEKEAWAARTDFEIPDEIEQNVSMAENEAYAKPALQTYLEEIAAREEASNLSAVNRYATSAADALAAVSGVSRQTSQARTQAAAQGEQVRQQNMGRVYDARETLAGYRTMQWDMNVNMPFLQRLQFAQQMQGAGYQGEITSLNQMQSDLTSAGSTMLGQGLAELDWNPFKK